MSWARRRRILRARPPRQGGPAAPSAGAGRSRHRAGILAALRRIWTAVPQRVGGPVPEAGSRGVPGVRRICGFRLRARLLARRPNAQRMNSRATRCTKSAGADSPHPAWSGPWVVERWGAHIGGLGACVAAVSTARRSWSPVRGFGDARLTVESTGGSVRIHKAERQFPTSLSHTQVHRCAHDFLPRRCTIL
jgi:hypothetical protein